VAKVIGEAFASEVARLGSLGEIRMAINLRLKWLRLRKSGAWSSVRLGLFLVYLVLMVFLVMALVKKGSGFFADTVPLHGEPSLREGYEVRETDAVPKEVLDFEAMSKPGLGAHGAAVRFPEQSETDVQEQLKVRSRSRPFIRGLSL
jgi:hypothetical protein